MSPTGLRRALVAAAVMGAATNPARADDGRAWWVVVGTVSASHNRLTPSAEAELRRIETAARRCGVLTFQEFSNRFTLFARGQMVVAAGPFPNRARADAVASKTVPCISGAYVKNSLYKPE
ncbi:hypothetical protein RA307_00655 [Xanthobacteraceae bacterium Astr-EGSB]|uniref:hypothetical protein n=1 Tax=Astrobacterium formosum TaxID=3069710 RepID=UPI0027B4EC65|nr:hypothetical protein [Xanthobacteraceae bacterium Astr-EGSB]